MSKTATATRVTALEEKLDNQGATLASMVALMERLVAGNNGNSVPQANPVQNAKLSKPIPEIAAINHAVIATDAPIRGNFATKVELAERAASRTGIQLEEGDDENIIEPLPQDNPNVKGPVWSGKTLRNKYGTFPAHHRRHSAQTKKLETVRFDVSPADRSNFMGATTGRCFGVEVTLAVPDGSGGEKIVRYPAVCNLQAKQFSSFDHGLYGKVESLVVTLPDGSEYILDGQVNLQLSKRIQ